MTYWFRERLSHSSDKLPKRLSISLTEQASTQTDRFQFIWEFDAFSHHLPLYIDSVCAPDPGCTSTTWHPMAIGRKPTAKQIVDVGVVVRVTGPLSITISLESGNDNMTTGRINQIATR